MPQLLVRNLEESTVNALKKLAVQHHRSLQSEAKQILEEAVRYIELDPAKLAAKIRIKLSSKKHSDSAKLIAKDRTR